MAGRRQPERTCVGCRGKTEKGALIRVVRGPDGRMAVDPTGRGAGRGAYVHPTRECLRLALRKGAIARALHASLGEAEAARLVEELERMVGEEA
jgi:predicted RNA-binding protein YlxR (DUF448 family)